MYTETTRSIKITVRPVYLEEHSSPADDHYVWAYHVRIENGGDETVQLRNRHWKIIDSVGRLQEVRGPGVVGEQPVLKPGQSFEYTSSCPLPTSSGFMVGDYEMESDGGERFLVRIPAFSLDSPGVAARPGSPQQPLRLN
ncbi:MAG TPA: Co2+/Mg2+ efflux protein ApaG [Stellaceae bacterium]|jgi:ApaG protein|nr:Co2+/Mg2+ efflux protein ApaG [Stellaceae bacterium]